MNDFTIAIDELNALVKQSYVLKENETEEQRAKRVQDDFLDFLISAYMLGVQNANKMLNIDLTVDIDKMYGAVFANIAGKTFEDRVVDHLSTDNLSGLQTLAESEYHRVYNTAINDIGYAYTQQGKQLTKVWRTMLDERVRETHNYLEGMEVPFNERFYTYDGDSARFPADFANASNNVNCRCYIELKADKAQS